MNEIKVIPFHWEPSAEEATRFTEIVCKLATEGTYWWKEGGRPERVLENLTEPEWRWVFWQLDVLTYWPRRHFRDFKRLCIERFGEEFVR
jgi:hypothetical protein